MKKEDAVLIKNLRVTVENQKIALTRRKAEVKYLKKHLMEIHSQITNVLEKVSGKEQ